METALDFAEAVLAVSGEGTTHLKLQKLVFYAYGAARAFGEAVPSVSFERWPHGPVCAELYQRHQDAKATPLQIPQAASPLTGAAFDAVRIYKKLTAWQLREESHRERPYTSRPADRGVIEDSEIVDHFRVKFGGPRVDAPFYLPGAWSLAVDGLPGVSARSLGELAALLDD